MKTWRIKERIKQIRNLFWLCLPDYIQKSIQETYEKRKLEQEMSMYRRVRVSEEDVLRAFSKLRIRGDVQIHSSLTTIGNIHGMYKPILQYLVQSVVEKGYNLLAIAIPIKGSSREYLQSIQSFSIDAPNAMGVLNKQIGKLTGACRSLEPTHSMIAVGPDAAYYIGEHHEDCTPFGRKSPYWKMLERNAQILMIGAPLKHLTICHMVEDLMGNEFPLKVYEKTMYDVQILQDGICVWDGKYSAHNKIAGALRVPDHVLNEIMNLPTTQVEPLGASQLILVNAREVILCVLHELIKGNTIYGHFRISNACRNKAEQIITEIQNMR